MWYMIEYGPFIVDLPIKDGVSPIVFCYQGVIVVITNPDVFQIWYPMVYLHFTHAM